MKYTNEELCYIWLDSFSKIEYKHKKELFNLINGKGEIKKLLTDGKDYVVNNIGQTEYDALVASANPSYLYYVVSALEKREMVAITIVSKDYPKTLLQTEFPPLVLYAKGNVQLLNDKSFSIVGSRKSLPLSINLAKDYAKALIDAKFTLVTGIAEGVDQAVLETAVKNKAKAISVVAGGLDHIYPKSNVNLANKVIENGLLISEYPPEIAPQRYMFPVRNRIIAALSVGSLIVSAGLKSGTIYTAEYAEEYGKDVFAIPYNVGVASGTGCNELIKRGVHLTDTPNDILEFYGVENQKQETALTDEEQMIVSVLSDGEMHIDKISEQVKKPVYEILTVLSMLEIKNVIVKNGANVYGLVRNLEG